MTFSVSSGAGHSSAHFGGLRLVKVVPRTDEVGAPSPVRVLVRDGKRLQMPAIEYPRPKTV